MSAPNVAYLLSIASAWSYANGQTLANKLTFYGCRPGSVDEISVVNKALCAVATAFFIRNHDGDVGVLVFRGTEPDSFINWLTDANTVLRPFQAEEPQVHSGFLANVDALWSDVWRVVGAAINGRTTSTPHDASTTDQCARTTLPKNLAALYVTGHSLGAAMAVLVGARMSSEPTVVGCLRGVYTFGQPMVGDAAFARWYAASFAKILFRHVYRADVVPRLPPWSMNDFVHLGEELYSASPTKAWKTTAAGRTRATRAWLLISALLHVFISFITRRVRYLNWLPVRYSLDDHSPEWYVEVCRVSVPAQPTSTAARPTQSEARLQ